MINQTRQNSRFTYESFLLGKNCIKEAFWMATATKSKTMEKAEIMNQILGRIRSFVTLDIETTALSPDKGGRIIEIAGVKVENGQIVDTYSQLIYPESKIYRKTIEITGITNEMLEGQPVYGQVLPEFYQFLGNSVVVAHNANFDWNRYLMYFFKKVGIQVTNEVVCTLTLSKLYYPERKTYKLEEVCNMNGISIPNHHRALDDALATAQLAIFYQKEFASQQGMLDLFSQPMEETDPIPVKTRTTFKIRRVRYWEKPITKKKKMQRIYVNMTIGSVYFDIPTQTWYNKDVEGCIDFNSLEQAVLKYLKLDSVLDLCFYRN